MNELINSINESIATFQQECELFVEKGNKSAARRARRATLDLEKLFKRFRKESIEASKVTDSDTEE